MESTVLLDEEVKVDKAAEFRKNNNGMSITFFKLLKKYNLSATEYRKLRMKRRKEGYIGPRREKKKVITN